MISVWGVLSGTYVWLALRVITERVVIISYRRLRTIHRSHPQGSRNQRKRVAQYGVYIRNRVGGENVSVWRQPQGLLQVDGRRGMWWSVQLESRSLIGGILSGTQRTFPSKRTRAWIGFSIQYTLYGSTEYTKLFKRKSRQPDTELDWTAYDLQNSKRLQEANCPMWSHPDSL